MAQVNENTNTKEKRGFSRMAKKLSTRVDLTPMVDLGFLLLTFFVFTTTLQQPTAMSITEPVKGGEDTPVKASAATTFILGKDNTIHYYFGQLNGDDFSGIKTTDYYGVRNIIMSRKQQVNNEHMMFLIKCDSSSTFKNNIDILDEMSINTIPKGHFAEVELNDIEKQEIQRLEAM